MVANLFVSTKENNGSNGLNVGGPTDVELDQRKHALLPKHRRKRKVYTPKNKRLLLFHNSDLHILTGNNLIRAADDIF